MAIEYRDGIAGKVCANPECNQWKPLSEFHPRRLLGLPVGDGYKSRCQGCMNAEKREKRAADPELHREVAREYVEANREHIGELKRFHQEEHPEEYLEAGRRYRDAHREEINAKARARRSANLEHYREIGRESRARHQEERNAYQRAYNKANPHKIAAAQNRRRAREYQAEGSHTIEEWEALKAQYTYTCLRCGKQEPEIELTRDHAIPLEQGGSDWISNVQPLCGSCNSKKSTKYIDYRA
ncbi:MAG: HNH endonuclease [Chloroflexota bacterium]